MPDVKKVNSGLLEFSEDQQILVAIDEDGEIQKAVVIDEDGSETPIGTTPTGKITITENGTDIDVAQYATADVAVEGGATVAKAEITVNLLVDGEPASEEFLETITETKIIADFVDSNENSWSLDDETYFLEPFTIDIYDQEAGVKITAFTLTDNDYTYHTTNVSVTGDITFSSGFGGGWVVKGNGTITIATSSH